MDLRLFSLILTEGEAATILFYLSTKMLSSAQILGVCAVVECITGKEESEFMVQQMEPSTSRTLHTCK